jgi:copper chaperone CopZ
MKTILLISVLALSLSNACANISGDLSSESKSEIVKDGIVTSTFTIANLGCGSDAAAMQKRIAQTKGVKTCVVDASKGTAVVKYDEKLISKEAITEIIENCSLCHDKNTKPFKVKAVN